MLIAPALLGTTVPAGVTTVFPWPWGSRNILGAVPAPRTATSGLILLEKTASPYTSPRP